MPLIDTRGRLFGRLNVIDAALIAFVLLLLPIGLTTVQLFRQRSPVIERVEPGEQPVGRDRRIVVRGRSLRPFLRAFVSPTGRPYSVLDRVAESIEGVVRLETPEALEVQLPPDTPAGTYDLYIYDELREVAKQSSAFVLTAPRQVEEALLVKIRFVVSRGLVQALKAGDEDVTELTTAKPTDPPQRPAVLTAFHVVGGSTAMFEMMQVPHRTWWIGRSLPDGTVVDATLRIPARQTRKGVWEYGDLPVRAGDPFFFQTPRYSISGFIDEVLVSPAAGGPPASPKATR